jgi:hypothetical protein
VTRPILAACAVVLLAVYTPACGGTQTSRAQTVASMYSGLNAASAALRVYESDHAEAVIAQVKAHTMTQDAGATALQALRAKVHPAEVARDAAYAALDTANTLNDDPSFAGARIAITSALGAINALTGSH